MNPEDIAAALIGALPDKIRCNDDRGLPMSHKLIARVIADEMAEQGYVVLAHRHHVTAEEAADCRTCSPSGLPRRIEGGDEHG